MRRLLFLLLASLILLGLAGGYGLYQPMHWEGEPREFTLPAGSNVRQAARIVAQQGVPLNPLLFAWYARLTGQAGYIKAGSYRVESGITSIELLAHMIRGDFAEYGLTIVEGWNFRQLKQAISTSPFLEDDVSQLTDTELLHLIGASEAHPEGLFFPDTYKFAKGSRASALLKQAYKLQQQRLAQAWEKRAPDLPLKSLYEALTLASIVEKETGQAKDRDRIAAVFVNRLRKGMLLQTDPTVIYGLGTKFDGNLRKRDLLTDTPYNTYTRAGLPPTPIALPGKAALQATLNPAQTNDLYFVARGDGSSQFSATLENHNRAVNKYQRGQ